MSKKQKDVLIRGVEEDAYRDIVSLAKRMNMNVGFLASQAFKLFVSLVEGQGTILLVPVEVARRIGRVVPRPVKRIVPRIIRYINRLTVNRSDLESTDSPLIFLGIGELVFEDDVTEKLFEEKVLRIVDCRVVEVPEHIRKFTVLSKASFVGELRVRRVAREL